MAIVRHTGVNLGLLVLRVGIGAMFIVHGLPKLTGGPEAWRGLGGAIGVFGITFAPVFWGFMAAFAEAVGGAALILGLLVRPFALLLLCTMIVATGMHLDAGHGFKIWSGPAGLGVVFLSLVLSGGGGLSLSRLIRPLHGRWFG